MLRRCHDSLPYDRARTAHPVGLRFVRQGNAGCASYLAGYGATGTRCRARGYSEQSPLVAPVGGGQV